LTPFTVDVQMQLLATPYKFIIVTSPIGLIIMQDNGDSGAQVGISLFGTLLQIVHHIIVFIILFVLLQLM